MGRIWPPVMPGFPIQSNDVSTLRNAIDQDLAAAGLAPQAWTWANVVPGSTILAKYYLEMRSAIQRLWDFKARGPLPLWTGGVAPGGPSAGTAATPIRASHVTDLRFWLNLYENNAAHSQGITSLSYDPTIQPAPP